MDPAAPARERARELLAVVSAHAAPDASAWLEEALQRTAAAAEGTEAGIRPFARGQFFGFYAGAGRRLRAQAAVGLPEGDLFRLRGAGIARPDVWSLPDLARGALLLAACAAAAADQHVSIATEAFRKGDNAERVALLRSLPLLPASERFTALAAEACRTHVLDVFAAIACENPFPAERFPELNFNQLVMKTLFLELALERVIGWRRRNNRELVRMATDYEAERLAAGRPVPADIALIKTAEVQP